MMFLCFKPKQLKIPLLVLLAIIVLQVLFYSYTFDSSIIVIHQVDPMFPLIRILKHNFIHFQPEFIKYEDIFDRQNTFQAYLSQNQYIRTNIDNISNVKFIDDQLYVQFNKNRLFEFLDLKYENLLKYMFQDQVFQSQSCHSKVIEDNELQNCKLFYEYIGKKLFLEYYEYKQSQLCEKVSTMTFSTQMCIQFTQTLSLSTHSLKEKNDTQNQLDFTMI
ncbi:unnamed protein product [Paramecium sonneborni]|uniref:Uncharacterized protein n=1 Tax=Paramecium sonneborni TaxID=65129 RepID=A0A8S1QDW7_9CILI|nr:unnamed protein product [Paramecium sonneborni]